MADECGQLKAVNETCHQFCPSPAMKTLARSERLFRLIGLFTRQWVARTNATTASCSLLTDAVSV